MNPRIQRVALAIAMLVAVWSTSVAPVAAQATGTIQGRVIEDQTRRPLAAAQVSVVGTRLVAQTDASGSYVLNGVPTGTQRVRANMIGHSAKEKAVTVAAGQIASANFELGAAVVALDELVVTGTAGDARQRTLGNAVTKIDAAEVVSRAPVQNVQELLNGRAAGVVVTPATGMVGSGSAIRIRGNSTLSLSGRPLLYVDGVRVDNAQSSGPTVQGFGTSVVSRLNDFNPEDIESIEIIKGPAAATLYGTEASNGVIQIITKKGKAGTPVFNFKVSQGANWFQNPEGRIPVTYARVGGEVQMLDIVDRENELGTPIFRTGHLQDYDLNLSGGEASVRYYLAGSLTRDEGAERNNYLNRVGGRANLTITPSEKIDVNGNLGYIKSHANLSREAGGGGIMWSTLFSSPARLTLPDGSASPLRGFRTAPPEVYYDVFENFQEVSRFTGSLQVNHRPASWFTQRLTFGTDQTVEDNQSLTERNEDFQFFFGILRGGKFAGRRDVSSSTLDYSGTATFDLRDGLTSSTSVGTQYYRKLTEFVSASGDEFPVPGLRVVDAAAVQRGGEDFFENTTVGLFVQQQFGWQDRLFLTAAIRADDNSAFGQEFDLVYYPKLSASWVVSEETFWNAPFGSTLKLRAAYGESGQQPDAFDALRTFAPVTGQGDAPAVTPQAVGNPSLGPERGKEIELGFDSELFNQRLGVQFTYYNKRTTDAILLRDIAPSTGFPGAQFVNIGEVRNSGVELLLKALAVDTRNVDLDLSFNFSSNENKVVDLGGDLETIVESSDFGVESRVGFPVSAWFHKRLVSAEVNDKGRAVNLMCDGGPENNGQAVPCADAPRVYLGRGSPKYEGAFSSALTLFNNLRVSALVDFKTGYQKWDSNTWVRCSIFGLCIENVLPQEADPVRLAAFQTSRVTGNVYINDASFAKLREVSASYTVPQGWANRFGTSRATITVAGRNLHTWTDWTGLDPEASYLGGRAGRVGIEQNNLPQLTQFVTTVNLSF
jgi:TonB-linked SusC/RagA family outer membrane protein